MFLICMLVVRWYDSFLYKSAKSSFQECVTSFLILNTWPTTFSLTIFSSLSVSCKRKTFQPWIWVERLTRMSKFICYQTRRKSLKQRSSARTCVLFSTRHSYLRYCSYVLTVMHLFVLFFSVAKSQFVMHFICYAWFYCRISATDFCFQRKQMQFLCIFLFPDPLQWSSRTNSGPAGVWLWPLW